MTGEQLPLRLELDYTQRVTNAKRCSLEDQMPGLPVNLANRSLDP